MALVIAAFGTLGIVAVIPVGAALIWFAQVGRSPGDRPSAPEDEEWQPRPRSRDPHAP